EDPRSSSLAVKLPSRTKSLDRTGQIASAGRRRLAWQPRPPAPVLTTRTPPGVIRTAASNHPCSQLFSTPLSKRRRRARTAYGHGCRLSIAHARSNGPLPRLARCFRASSPHGSSPDGGKTSCAASRRDWPFRSHEKPRRANFRGGLAEYGNVDGVARDAAPSCADAATNRDRRG